MSDVFDFSEYQKQTSVSVGKGYKDSIQILVGGYPLIILRDVHVGVNTYGNYFKCTEEDTRNLKHISNRIQTQFEGKGDLSQFPIVNAKGYVRIKNSNYKKPLCYGNVNFDKGFIGDLICKFKVSQYEKRHFLKLEPVQVQFQQQLLGEQEGSVNLFDSLKASKRANEVSDDSDADDEIVNLDHESNPQRPQYYIGAQKQRLI